MSFRDQACAHLSGYRKGTLGIAEEGLFAHRGEDLPMGHILPLHSRWRNLIPPYDELFRASGHGSTKPHKFFHHLNSSQALCFNLFFPLLHEKAEALLVRSLGSDMGLPVTACFEKPSPLEQAARLTSFDFHLANEAGRQLFVEVKYTEDGFGAAKDDDEHRDKFHATYAPMLEGSAYLAKECNEPGFFLDNYQVLRNLVHITPDSEVVFLFPRANEKVAGQAAHARETFLTEAGRERMRIVFLEGMVEGLIEACRGTALDGYYESFRRKFLDFTP
jgi:hypothetical protein